MASERTWIFGVDRSAGAGARADAAHARGGAGRAGVAAGGIARRAGRGLRRAPPLFRVRGQPARHPQRQERIMQ